MSNCAPRQIPRSDFPSAANARIGLQDLRYKIDVNTLHRDEDSSRLGLNEIGRVQLRTSTPLLIDEYRRNRATGSFILIEEITNGTVGAGMITGIEDWSPVDVADRSANVAWHARRGVSRARWSELAAAGATVWFTGLPASGKSTIGVEVERGAAGRGRAAYLLDGDNLRHGLNGDLGFSEEDRKENIRRTAEVARLMADSGMVAIEPRRPFTPPGPRPEMHERDGLPFVEIWVSTPLEECEQRDTKGLYAKARAGEMKGLPG